MERPQALDQFRASPDATQHLSTMLPNQTNHRMLDGGALLDRGVEHRTREATGIAGTALAGFDHAQELDEAPLQLIPERSQWTALS